MRKLYEIFKVLKVQKRIVSAETICGNTVSEKTSRNKLKKNSFHGNYSQKYGFANTAETRTVKMYWNGPSTLYFTWDIALDEPSKYSLAVQHQY